MKVVAPLVRAQPLAIELVSTVYVHGGRLVDALESVEQLRVWLGAYERRLPATDLRATDEAVRRMRELREALRVLFTAVTTGTSPDGAAITHLNAVLACSPEQIRLMWEGQEPTVERWRAGRPDEQLLAELAASGAELLGEHSTVLRACLAPSCVLFFKKDHPRQEWCSPACGNRARVARHYQRLRRPSTE